MNEMQLSMRLRTVAEEIPKNTVVADIGSDHAYLPCYAYLNNMIKGAIAGEVNDGPLKSAVNQVKRCGITDHISVRKGNGLAVIEPNEVEVVIIAGMGGQLISNILNEGKDKLKGVQRLILQPNVGSRFVRLWLRQNGWTLIREQILEEDDKIYEILTAEKGEDKELYKKNEEAMLLFGPLLLKEKHPAFRKKWAHELENWKRIMKQMEDADESDTLLERKNNINKKIQLAEGVL
ncbi:tRNA (adenine(22)-N(1))-methyltransferase [Bacillus solimangrovi]|uniref:SAM-dependent methyltransferase n=1 Tax=Bacillus solimangrovi TaxID=1305675 RepID=A0A1E5LI16_9BACI|nr:tRNA (adenine(22)-N(1))-methyltransferase TrmK [Bacillus solimangrovi]OEH93717.1 SAM-dependent methyltransferase [Bacillus solimangrovi]